MILYAYEGSEGNSVRECTYLYATGGAFFHYFLA